MQSQAKTSQGPKGTERPLSKLQTYLYANLLFWGFLVLVGVVAFFALGRVWDSVTAGTLRFLFLIMGGGFTLVSVMDFIYEKYAGGEKE